MEVLIDIETKEYCGVSFGFAFFKGKINYQDEVWY